MTRSDLLLAVNKIHNSACPIDDTRKLIYQMHQKIENVYEILFDMEEFAKTDPIWQPLADKIREALES